MLLRIIFANLPVGGSSTLSPNKFANVLDYWFANAARNVDIFLRQQCINKKKIKEGLLRMVR